MTHQSKEKENIIGTKVALINNGQVLVSLRDDKPGIDFPGMWDFPGGEREGGEDPFHAGVREIEEELGIDISQNEMLWERIYPAAAYPDKKALFMVINITDDQVKSIIFGDEGQEWRMMAFKEFTNHHNAVPGMQTRLRNYLELDKVKKIPVFTTSLTEYKVDFEPDHEVIGRAIDDEIKKHFLGQDILVRGVASSEHPDKSADELIKIIQEKGTDRYDQQRKGDRYENIEGKHIDFFALRFDVAKDSKMFSQLTWPFYHWGIKSRGFALRCDILMIYDPSKLEQIKFTYAGREHEGLRDDGFVFKDPQNKLAAVKAIFKITG